MRIGNLDIKAPLILGGEESEAEVLGATVWLWMHSPMHRDAPLHALPTLLLPIIKRRQYVLISENERPVFFLSWAWLNEESEARYLTRPSIEMKEEDWDSGDRMWFCDWIAPFGHTSAIKKLIRDDIFPDHCWRALYHRGAERGKRVVMFHGGHISRTTAREWQLKHPLTVNLPEALKGTNHE
ncbi:toxin-activating lysine-acyltransferase [Enterobacter soli]|jgi:cytolysin-activating lysine-acyltransferase|uniref:RTX toxin-activating lysine-acyltransferase n=1 Tax=Enterobacter soli TaxID=885040 RepID=A0AAW8H9N0_9ENTR|nr:MULTISPECIES: toxin-activating lysine-acyltransferase [Enterobacter]AEN66083.1 RTX toxin-activating protein C [Enterobacter soli]MCR1316888.1 toxin-activating lysine-acyltransferase [Enterobacter soli]MDQ2257285.1 toxin-activating lysine-acyltransferase [Enterobacter soli]MDQ2336645.1 toxin-activating lysine-acyltransferase [Enterobacter soli]MDR7938420.1 toxin-activating lysine-acyltransferase [Enterobacter soli]